MRYKTSDLSAWVETKSVAIVTDGGRTAQLTLRTSENAAVYAVTDEGETLVAVGIGEFEIVVAARADFVVRIDGSKTLRSFVKTNVANTMRVVSLEPSFTNLERPKGPNPEMIQIQRIMKQNELARQELEAKVAALMQDRQ